jgi:hypothetical protein
MVQHFRGLGPQRVAQVVSNRVHRLQQFLSTDHFAFRGTFDAAIAESQGAAMPRDRKTSASCDFRSPIDHIANLDNGRRAVTQHIERIEHVVLGGVEVRDPRAASFLHVVLQPIKNLAQDRQRLADSTMRLIGELRAAGHQSLAGAPIMAKGRSESALVSSQLRNMNSPWPGSRDLVPRTFMAHGWVIDTLEGIARLPFDEPTASEVMSQQAASARSFVRESLRSAGDSPELLAIGTGLLRMWSPGGELQGTPGGGAQEYYNYPTGGGGGGDAGGNAGGDAGGGEGEG